MTLGAIIGLGNMRGQILLNSLIIMYVYMRQAKNNMMEASRVIACDDETKTSVNIQWVYIPATRIAPTQFNVQGNN